MLENLLLAVDQSKHSR
jgi:nucleotide-binding universal stress UspA family protein